MHLLLLSMLFPNAAQPYKGQFVRERLRQMRQRSSFEWTVIAPVPWFPFRHERFGAYADFARVPVEEEWEGIRVFHPRYPVIPRVGDAVSPLAYAGSVARCVHRHDIRFDAIDAHFFFPDGVAAVMVGQRLGRPVAVTARGSDINVMPDEMAAGRWIRWAARRCDRLVAVSDPLGRRLAEVAGDVPVLVAPNGVDTERFRPNPCRERLRARLGLSGLVLLSVGNLIELKGHHLVIEALRGLPDASLMIAGDGPWRQRLEQRARELDVAARVRFLGAVEQSELADYYGAADRLVLASSSEGSPNVVLESLACGTPVVTTVAAAVQAGPCRDDVTLADRCPEGIRKALHRSLTRDDAREAVRLRARSLSWDTTCRSLEQMFRSLPMPAAGRAAG